MPNHIIKLNKLITCKDCFTFYYDDSWHLKIPMQLQKNRKEEVKVWLTQCLPCKLAEDVLYQKIL